jgi:amino acid permease
VVSTLPRVSLLTKNNTHHSFYNGGMVFSVVVLMFIAMISLYSFLLLVRTRLVVHGSFGDIGGILYGKYMRSMILFSIVLSQVRLPRFSPLILDS